MKYYIDYFDLVNIDYIVFVNTCIYLVITCLFVSKICRESQMIIQIPKTFIQLSLHKYNLF